VVPLDRLLDRLVDPPTSLLIAASSGLVVVAQRDAGTTGELLDGLHEIEVLDLAHEGDGVALRAATEAIVQAELGVDGE